MATYVLIHGGSHGAWCWSKVVPLLEAKGHRVVAPDLPGHGKDETPIQEVTLQSCVDKVCRVIEAQNEPVILVGHSMGGLVISQVAECIPNKIKMLVYLTASMLQDGESCASLFETFNSFFDFSRDQNFYTIKSKIAASLFYNDCSKEDVDKALSLLGPEATNIFKTTLHLSNEKYGSVPRIYIECLRDHTLSPDTQKSMYTASPCLRVISLNTGHSPFLSAPEQLTACLLILLK